jgi:hypothetical protein
MSVKLALRLPGIAKEVRMVIDTTIEMVRNRYANPTGDAPWSHTDVDITNFKGIADITFEMDHSGNYTEVESREKLELWREPSGWVVRTNDPETIEIMGTDVLPTAFTALASADMVVTRIRELNPDADVVLV